MLFAGRCIASPPPPPHSPLPPDARLAGASDANVVAAQADVHLCARREETGEPG